MKPYRSFFDRVLYVASLRVHSLCTHLGVNDGTAEMIWSVLQVLLSQETDLLIGRHLDQLIMCTIYGMLRVHHQTCYTSGQKDINKLFGEINEAYTFVNRFNSQMKKGN